MNILTDILSLFKRKKFVKEAKANDVLVLGLNEEPDMTGVASPIPYKSVRLIKVKDLVVKGEACEYTNVVNGTGTKPSYIYKDTTQDPCSVNLRSIAATGNYISVLTNNNEIEISTTAEPNRAANVGGGIGVFRDKTGALLNFKSIVGAGNVTITDDGDTIQISSSGGGDQTSAINIGGGQEVFESEIGDQLRFRTLIGAGDIDIQTKGDTISISTFTTTPKIFRALLSQAGSNAPVITVLENTTDFTLSVVYDGVGTYQFDFSNALPDVDKVLINISQVGKSSPFLFNINSISNEDFSLQTYFGSTNVLEDSQLLRTPLEILVYS